MPCAARKWFCTSSTLGIQSPFTFHRGPAIREMVLAASWAARTNEDRSDVFTAARKQTQAERRFMCQSFDVIRLNKTLAQKIGFNRRTECRQPMAHGQQLGL